LNITTGTITESEVFTEILDGPSDVQTDEEVNVFSRYLFNLFHLLIYTIFVKEKDMNEEDEVQPSKSKVA
jgi:hypothetical protein